MRRKIQFAPGFYYHLCNKSNDGKTIFFDERDYARMIFFLLFYQFPTPFFNIGRSVSYFIEHTKFNIAQEAIVQMRSKQQVELNAFAIMPNHFHLLIQEKEKGGISSYLQRLEGGYAKYFNAKYQRGGHVFRGSFRAVPVEKNEQLLYLSAYIHRNPRSLEAWTDKEISYPWSSYQDFARENRWKELLNPNIVLNQFTTQKFYQEFVDTSTAKLKENEIHLSHLFLE
ncbi:MAG: transposase [bacterium]|nr:transposase [bacterium]